MSGCKITVVQNMQDTITTKLCYINKATAFYQPKATLVNREDRAGHSRTNICTQTVYIPIQVNMRLDCTLYAVVVLAHCLGWVSSVKVSIDLDTLVNTVEPEFLSVTLDSIAFIPSRRFNILQQSSNDPRLVNLLSALAPAYFRVGGTYSSYVVFDTTEKKPLKGRRLFHAGKPLSKQFTMSPKEWDFLVEVTRNAGLQLLYDFNAQLLHGTDWLPSNAIKLLDYCASKGYGENLHFEIGNEPRTYWKHDSQRLTGFQIADSFNTLRELMDNYPLLNNSKLVGPDQVSVKAKAARRFLSDIVENCGHSLDAVTFHHYNVARAPRWQSLVKPQEFEELRYLYNVVRGVVDATSNSGLPVWIGEGGDTFSSQTIASRRYASGFLWLDKLGVSARIGLNVVMRQCFYGRNAGLVYLDYFPQPDYWLSVIFKKIVGQKVLDLNLLQDDVSIRAYAHCAETRSGQYSSSDVVVYAMNLNKTRDIELTFDPELQDKQMDVYHLMPDGDDPEPMLSQYVSLNGVRLGLENGNTTLPKFIPNTVPVSEGFKLPALQFSFFVIRDVNAPACM